MFGHDINTMSRWEELIHDFKHITETSHEHHGISNHWQLYCLLNSLIQLTTKETSMYQEPRYWFAAWRHQKITRTKVDQASVRSGSIHLRSTAQEMLKISILGMSLKMINSSSPSAAYMHQWTGSTTIHLMACRLFSAKPLPEPVLAYCQLDSWEQVSS